MNRAVVYALSACILGAMLEGLFAGRDVRKRLASLRMPSYALPFWAWMIVGGLYYLICFAVLYRLFLHPSSVTRSLAFTLVATLMFINALWNYFFFRTRNLFHAYLLGLPYSVIALGLLLLLSLQLDRIAALCFLPYTLYLLYGNYWGRRIWKLNPKVAVE